MTNACTGLADHLPCRDHAHCYMYMKHAWCRGIWVKLVPGQIEYATGLCACPCHGGAP